MGRAVVEIPARPRVGGGHFSITLHDPSRWQDPQEDPSLPWLPITMIFDLPHLHAALMTAPGAERRQGLFMLDTGASLPSHFATTADEALLCCTQDLSCCFKRKRLGWQLPAYWIL